MPIMPESVSLQALDLAFCSRRRRVGADSGNTLLYSSSSHHEESVLERTEPCKGGTTTTMMMRGGGGRRSSLTLSGVTLPAGGANKFYQSWTASMMAVKSGHYIVEEEYVEESVTGVNDEEELLDEYFDEEILEEDEEIVDEEFVEEFLEEEILEEDEYEEVEYAEETFHDSGAVDIMSSTKQRQTAQSQQQQQQQHQATFPRSPRTAAVKGKLDRVHDELLERASQIGVEHAMSDYVRSHMKECHEQIKVRTAQIGEERARKEVIHGLLEKCHAALLSRTEEIGVEREMKEYIRKELEKCHEVLRSRKPPTNGVPAPELEEEESEDDAADDDDVDVEDVADAIVYVLRQENPVDKGILTPEQALRLRDLPIKSMKKILQHFEDCDNAESPIDWDHVLKILGKVKGMEKIAEKRKTNADGQSPTLDDIIGTTRTTEENQMLLVQSESDHEDHPHHRHHHRHHHTHRHHQDEDGSSCFPSDDEAGCPGDEQSLGSGYSLEADGSNCNSSVTNSAGDALHASCLSDDEELDGGGGVPHQQQQQQQHRSDHSKERDFVNKTRDFKRKNTR